MIPTNTGRNNPRCGNHDPRSKKQPERRMKTNTRHNVTRNGTDSMQRNNVTHQRLVRGSNRFCASNQLVLARELCPLLQLTSQNKNCHLGTIACLRRPINSDTWQFRQYCSNLAAPAVPIATCPLQRRSPVTLTGVCSQSAGFQVNRLKHRRTFLGQQRPKVTQKACF